MKITVIGVGAYSLAITKQLAKNKNHQIVMWTESQENYEIYQKENNLKNIIDLDIPENVSITREFEDAIKDTNLIFFITSAKYLRNICKNIKAYYNPKIPICIASKGIENDTCELLSNVVYHELNAYHIAVISGPTFAIDLINDEPCALALAGTNRKVIKLVKNTLETNSLKLRKSSDLLGIQICGSIKNVIAIAAGILKGMGYSESTQAFLINESLHDIKNIIYYLGGKKKTILSFAGIGDLLLTCSSTKSRNYSFGYVIGSTKSKEKISEYLSKNTVEGYYTLTSIYNLLNKKGINIPLINTIYNIVMNGENPNTLTSLLISKN